MHCLSTLSALNRQPLQTTLPYGRLEQNVRDLLDVLADDTERMVTDDELTTSTMGNELHGP